LASQIKAQEEYLDAVLRHHQMPSIEERLTDPKCDVPIPADIKLIRYEPSDFIGFQDDLPRDSRQDG
jgi:hypothetical protein